ncbi:MAG: tRNA (adenosine(37)-N6)-threonylcarbamoyltransferase complex dimerization subunit type 1 TsaB [Ginsengibacter sp.]
MEYLLNIDTTTENAIVCLSKGSEVISSATNPKSKEHAAFLHVAIHQILKENSLSVSELKAIGVVGGPGSYTGIRVGLSTAKGLCYALNIPLMMYNTLELMAFSALGKEKNFDAMYCPMLDARRMEVFTAVYDSRLASVFPPSALELTENTFASLIEKNTIYFFGNGAQKFKDLIKSVGKNAYFPDNHINSESLASFGWNKFENKEFVSLISSKPLYLKEFYTNAKLR